MVGYPISILISSHPIPIPSSMISCQLSFRMLYFGQHPLTQLTLPHFLRCLRGKI